MTDALRIVVTGASRGVGLALTRHLIADGHAVVGAVRDPAAATELAATGAAIVELDVTRPATIEQVAEGVGAQFEAVDMLVNNAGIKRTADHEWAASAGPLGSVERDAFLDVIGTNTVGPLLVTQALHSMFSPGARIVNVSSQLGSLAAGVDVDYAYNASKAALNMVTVTMARDAATSGLVVASLTPGWIKTDMTADDDAPLELGATTREIATFLPQIGPEHSGGFFDRFGATVAW